MTAVLYTELIGTCALFLILQKGALSVFYHLICVLPYAAWCAVSVPEFEPLVSVVFFQNCFLNVDMSRMS